jgi:HEPN domain-containing protein
LSSLGNEKIRWLDLSEEYKRENSELEKKVFISAAQIIYYGPFTEAYRNKISAEWLP